MDNVVPDNVVPDNVVPANFKTIIVDWTRDLSTTFSEYAYLWSKWTYSDISDLEISQLYNYCLTVYPERFFDILYQNSELFDVDTLKPEINTCFLPGVEFKLLFNCPGISENIVKTMWKYLQLVLFTVVGSVHDKSKFGESANMFEGLDENELHTKLQDAMTSMGDFFQNMQDQSNDTIEDTGTDQSSANKDIPDVDELHGHLKGLFDGKIGNLAKELAEEISGDMADILGKDGENIKSTADVLKNMMRNPTKISGLIKTVSNKLQQKMNTGEISQDELIKEAMNIIGKMKGGGSDGGGGGGDFQEMFKSMAGMAGMAGMSNGGTSNGGTSNGGGADFQEMFKNMAGMVGMNIPKNAKMDTNAIDRMTKDSTMKDRMRNKMIEKRAKEEAAALAKQRDLAKQIANYKPYDFLLEDICKDQETQKLVFKIEGDTPQLTSNANMLSIANSIDEPKVDVVETLATKKKKKKNKK